MTSTALRSATALAACILCAAGDASLAQSSTAPREAQTVAPSAALRIGDRVKIGFFDSVDLGAGRADANPAAPPGLRAFYQRVDLTSEQAVDSDGGLRIPRLGAFVAAGKDVAALELEIAQAYRNETGRETQVQVSLVERAPVYVMGYVRAPGAQRYAPGLLAIHAVALAGGVERSRDSLPEMREARRERERQAQAEERLKRLLARHARLTAQQAGSRNVAAPAELRALASAEEVARFVAAEGHVRAVLEQGRAAEDEGLAAALQAARSDLAGLKTGEQKMAKQMEARVSRLASLKGLNARGYGNLEALNAAQKDVADFEFQLHQLRSLVQQAEQRAALAEQARKRAAVERESVLAREAMAIEEELAVQRKTAQAAADAARLLELDARQAGLREGQDLKFEITRRSIEGVAAFEADPTAALEPGDVVNVQARPAGETPAPRPPQRRSTVGAMR